MEDGKRAPNGLDSDMANKARAEDNGKKEYSNGREQLLTEGTRPGNGPAVPGVIPRNNEDIEMDENYSRSEPDHIGQACETNKALLTCSQFGERETLENNGDTIFNRKTIKCGGCRKQYSRETVINILDREMRKEWRTKLYEAAGKEISTRKI